MLGKQQKKTETFAETEKNNNNIIIIGGVIVIREDERTYYVYTYVGTDTHTLTTAMAKHSTSWQAPQHKKKKPSHVFFLCSSICFCFGLTKQ